MVVGDVVEAQWQLPAHVRLPVERPLAGVERGDVQRAAGSAGEPGAVEEDARPVDEAGDGGPVLGVEVAAASTRAMELPLVGGQPSGGLGDDAHVVVVDEVRAVAATALGQLGGVTVEHALAAAAEDARPRRAQERGVEHPRAPLVVVLEAHPLVQVEGAVAQLGGTRISGHPANLPR